ncbi:ABC transporter permease [Paracoccus aminophilus]|uniref:ABC-type multidrug transport system, permease component n=1 Tax=Paracoccus aminophilus JCM 7686 TaxID=1367847 RepID=S5XV99_PARAH|nr:ABC transporter permease [Paracoccus aminophilus]AGT09162.1 ABC-type multidrug transport system, permease component [Paracoccus aminophilus JCM 7686]
MIGLLRAMGAALRRMLGEKASRSTMVMSIIIYSALYPQPYTAEVVQNVPVAVVDQDGTPMSRELARRIDAADTAAVIARPATLAEAQARFYARDLVGIVIIPAHFQRDLLAGDAAPIAAYGDAGYFMTYNAMMSAVGGAARSLGSEIQYGRLTAQGLDPGTAATLTSALGVVSVSLFNPQGGYASYVLPAAFVLILQQTLMMGIAILHSGRKPETGMALVATPLAYILFYCLWIGVTQMLLPLIYNIPRLGPWWHLYLVAVPFLMAVTALGFALAQVFRAPEGMIGLLVVMGLPLFFLSGVSWPIESTPALVRHLAMAIPSTTAIPAVVQVDQMGSGLAAVSGTIRLQLLLALFYGALALGLHGWRGPQAARGS